MLPKREGQLLALPLDFLAQPTDLGVDCLKPASQRGIGTALSGGRRRR
jgi:hypothetical protein